MGQQHISPVSANEILAVFQSIAEGITVENRAGDIMHANDQAAELFGYEKSTNMVGITIREVLKKYRVTNADGKPVTYRHLPAYQIFTAEKKHHEELFYFEDRQTDEGCWIHIKATVVENNGNKPDLCIKLFQNVTEYIEEQKHRELIVEMASHEFKNPLASIKAYTELIRRRIRSGRLDEAYTMAEQLSVQVDRMVGLVGNLLDVSKIRAGLFAVRRTDVNVRELVQEVIQHMRTLQKNHLLVIRKNSIEQAFVDPDRMRQVLVNILMNALTYTKPSSVFISSYQKGDAWVLSIHDQGDGISPTTMSTIFKPYKKVPPQNDIRSTGVGLGLPIVHAIVRHHGGTIYIDSSAKDGTTITITIPLYEKPI